MKTITKKSKLIKKVFEMYTLLKFIKIYDFIITGLFLTLGYMIDIKGEKRFSEI